MFSLNSAVQESTRVSPAKLYLKSILERPPECDTYILEKLHLILSCENLAAEGALFICYKGGGDVTL